MTITDHLRSGLATCNDQSNPDKLDADVNVIWKRILSRTYPELYTAAPPDPDSWHKGFRWVLLGVSDASHLFPFARHVGASLGLAYPKASDVESRYIHDLRTPEGTINFDALFEKALNNVLTIWEGLDSAINGTATTALDQLEDWNLDTGRSLKTDSLVFWKENT